MRIARIAERVPPCRGGKEIHVAELSRRQAADHEVEVFFGHGDASTVGAPVRQIRFVVPAKWSGRLPATAAFLLAAAPVVLLRHRRSRFDVVHAHGDFLEAAALIVLRLVGRVPVVLTIHGGLSPRWAKTTGRLAGRLDGVIVVGTGVRQQLVDVGVEPGIVHVISSGVDCERVAAASGAPVTEIAAGDRPAYLFAGSLNPVKGLDVLLAAFDELRRTQPSASLWLIGDGPQAERLRRIAGEGVHFLGARPRDDVYAWMHAADVVVLSSVPTSSQSEGVPTVLLEALAAGRRIVASESGSVRDILDDEVASLCPPGDPRSLARALAGAADPEDEGAAARRRAIASTRSWDAVAQAVTHVLRRSA